MIEIYVDGSADNVKKVAPSYTAVWIPGREKTDIQECDAKTSNEAEYMALIAGMVQARAAGMTGWVTMVSDSRLVVCQMKHEWKCNWPALVELRDRALREAVRDSHLHFRYRWCRREVNQAGIAMDRYLKRKKLAG